MGHLSKTLPKARDHPQYRPKQAMQQERLAGFKEFVQSQWTGLLFGYSKRLGYGGRGSFMYWNLVISRVVVKSSEVTGLQSCQTSFFKRAKKNLKKWQKNLFKGLQVWFQMAPNGSKWLQETPNGYKWLKMAPNGSKWLQMAPNGSKWLQMALNGSKWL